MSLAAGTRFGPYELAALLGAGGMGEVYRAHDTRLQRDVALKILNEDVAANHDRRARFEREARAVAALSHPNIVALYDIGEDSGRLYMVSELVAGETLRERLRNGALTVRETLEIAVQIADGMATAHEAGITHRDLKPENVMIASGKTVKILDFGLARVAGEKTIAANDATVTVHHQTQPGIVMGTPHYMSPEQARGAATDYRSDQFSLGVILHEMLTGKPAFRRASIPETMVAILREDAPPLDTTLPTPLRWIIERLLAKDAEDRYASSKDLYRDLRSLRERLSEMTSSGALSAIAKPPARRPWWPYALAAGLIAGASLALILTPSSGDSESQCKFTPLAQDEASQDSPRWSPDGKSIVYRANMHGVYQVFVRVVGAPNAEQLTHNPSSCYSPSWSPDGSTIYYSVGASRWAVGASGGPPQLASKINGDVAKHPDGKTLAIIRNGKLFIGPADESQQKEYRRGSFPAEVRSGALQFSRDGSKLSVALPAAAAGQGSDLWILPWQSAKPPQHLSGIPRLSSVSWFPDSRHVLFDREDAATSALVVLDTETNLTRTLWSSPDRIRSPSLSPDGTRIALSCGRITSEVAEVSLANGRISTLLEASAVGMLNFNDWAPSGTHYLHTTDMPAVIEDRSIDEGFARTVVSMQSEGIPATGAAFQNPRWAPDGRRFSFSIGFGGGAASRQLWIANISSGKPFPVPGTKAGWGASWSPDGDWIAYFSIGDAPKYSTLLCKVRASAGGTPSVLADGLPISVGQSCWSPADDWILYPGAGGLSVVSPDGKTHRTLRPRVPVAYGFSKRGDQVYGVDRDSTSQRAWRLISIDVKSGAEKQLATLDLPGTTSIMDFSLHPDGNRFITSINRSRYDIYMLEGFNQPKSWIGHLTSVWRSRN